MSPSTRRTRTASGRSKNFDGAHHQLPNWRSPNRKAQLPAPPGHRGRLAARALRPTTQLPSVRAAEQAAGLSSRQRASPGGYGAPLRRHDLRWAGASVRLHSPGGARFWTSVAEGQLLLGRGGCRRGGWLIGARLPCVHDVDGAFTLCKTAPDATTNA
jgi:hypothetical protein